jgi:hypothetical protein
MVRDRLHVLVRALSMDTGALYSKQFLDWTELEAAHILHNKRA